MKKENRVTKWTYITALGGDKWALPILGAINDAVNQGKPVKLEEDKYELVGSISRKLTMIPRIVKRIFIESMNLVEEVKEKFVPTCIFTRDNNGGHTLDVNDDLKFQLLCDIDSFLFEVNSCCEFIEDFLYQILINSGKNIDKESVSNYFKNIIKNKGGKTEWFKDLDKFRNIFIHKRAPYIAIDLTDSNNYKILIMVKIKQKFENEDDFIRTEIFNGIYKGFEEAKIILKEYIIDYLKKL